MKLIDLTTEILNEQNIEGNTFVVGVALSEGIVDAFIGVKNEKGAIIKGLQGVGQLITNPVVAGMAIGYAVDAYSKYKRNKNLVTRLFAKTQYEKPFYERMIRELVKGGHYKLVSTKSVDGGTLWSLRRS